jgi:hypothetical protein
MAAKATLTYSVQVLGQQAAEQQAYTAELPFFATPTLPLRSWLHGELRRLADFFRFLSCQSRGVHRCADYLFGACADSSRSMGRARF